MIFKDSARIPKNLSTKKAMLCHIIPIIIVVVVILMGLTYIKNLFRECNESTECGENVYCGVDYKCHQMPGNTYSGKTIVKHNYGWAMAILGIGIIISLKIWYPKKIKWPLDKGVTIILFSLILAAGIIIVESYKCTSIDACGADAYCGSNGKCHSFNEPKVTGERNYILISTIAAVLMIVLTFTIKYKNTNLIKALMCCSRKRK